MDDHTIFMKRAFDLAMLGLGRVSPNPLVGCVIVKNGEVIGEGYHQKYGGPHAEVNAVNSVMNPDRLKGSSVFVSLEPCSHYGKTPPCADMLIARGVGEVVISNVDPNPLVSGKGVEKLQAAGIKVITRVLEKEGAGINKRFFTSLVKKRPYIILKWAQTADGFIARKNYESKWISNEYSRKLVHKWRLEEDAIMVGTNTAHYDNPSLNVRDWPNGRPDDTLQPVRVVVDRNLRLGTDLKLFDQSQKTICFNSKKNESMGNVEFVRIENDKTLLKEMLSELHSRQIQSVIVEGGATTLNTFIEEDLWDEARIFQSETTFGQGIPAPRLSGSPISLNKLQSDTLSVFINS